MPDFCHLHCHTQYSLLDGAANIGAMMKKAAADGQQAVALTDHGNMFGAFKFVKEAKANGVKPIVGCEVYLVEDRFKKSFLRSKGDKDKRYHQLLLAKNKAGYQNLSKLCSVGFTEGMYQKFPRVDREIIEKYHEGLIATSCCIGAEVPQTILTGDIEKAEERLKWWLDIFGEDYYIELQRHKGLETIDDTGMSQEDVNQVLLKFAKKYNVKTIVTNDSHYVEEEDWQPHDILLCINTNSQIEEEKRFRFPSSDFYFKSKDEMAAIFKDVPDAIDNTMEIASKVEVLDLARDVVLPAFPLPDGFDSQDVYLRYLTYNGAKKRYGEVNEIVKDRLDFELGVISESGYPGYFLIVQDLTSSARKMGVAVGPGRGSAAGSAVAYCLGITSIDPIKYNLLFERFLNPERISMPDIDIDFDDEGRSKVIDYVLDKYGKRQVAQIITYGTMAARMSLRDVGRVMNIPIPEVDKVVKKFPSHLKASLNAILEKEDIKPSLKEELNEEDKGKAYQFRKLAKEDTLIGKMIKSAHKIEGSIRNTGIHACGLIITPDDITNYVPVSLSKDNDLLVSQFDNSVVEEAGLLKMDFLGLRTLSIIKDAVKMINRNDGIHIDIDKLDLEDQKTYELFQRGDTIGIFQYESVGMQKHLKNLKPNRFEDLIAMNALFRPGPMAYIPNYIARKAGKEVVLYDLPAMEEYLSETYGITVYQEQVMLLSQKLAGFSKGQADMLRKAMGKKKKKLIDEMYPIFEEGCNKNGHPQDVIKKIWKDWEAFASYAFNKSHSTCYAYVAFQTAYLKAHHPSAFMAAVLNHNSKDISKLNFFLRECKRMGIKVLSPDINESEKLFTYNREGDLRFGLVGLKGVGEGPVEEIISSREKDGKFDSIFHVTKRLNLRAVNKKCLESLVLGGAFDNVELKLNRSTYLAPSGKYDTFIEHALKFGNSVQEMKNSTQKSLFAGLGGESIEEPVVENVSEWSKIERLQREKEVAGIYISGHPLDDYRLELKHYINCPLDKVAGTKNLLVKLAGLVTEEFHGVSQRGNEYGKFVVQDYTGSLNIMLYSENYKKWKDLFRLGEVLYIEGSNQKGHNSDRVSFRIKEVRLLDSVSKALTKSITLKLPVTDISDELIAGLDDLCKKYTGNHDLKIILWDRFENENIELDLISKGRKVDANYKFVDLLEEMGLKYKLN